MEVRKTSLVLLSSVLIASGVIILGLTYFVIAFLFTINNFWSYVAWVLILVFGFVLLLGGLKLYDKSIETIIRNQGPETDKNSEVLTLDLMRISNDLFYDIRIMFIVSFLLSGIMGLMSLISFSSYFGDESTNDNLFLAITTGVLFIGSIYAILRLRLRNNKLTHMISIIDQTTEKLDQAVSIEEID